MASKSTADIDADSTAATRALHFHGHVLHLRGVLTPQPVTGIDGSMLLWNGEVFGGLDMAVDDNDTQARHSSMQHLDLSRQPLTGSVSRAGVLHAGLH